MTKIKEIEQNLRLLGRARETHQDCQGYLIALAVDYQRLLQFALTTAYHQDEVFDLHKTLRLATNIGNRSTVFSNTLHSFGQTVPFEDQTLIENCTDDSSEESSEGASIPHQQSVRSEKRKFESLENILHEDKLVCAPDSGIGIMQWLRKLYKQNRGLELGTFSPETLAVAWKKQSAKWDDIALGYISDVIVLVHSFVVDLLTEVVRDEDTRQKLLEHLTSDMLEKYESSIQQTKFLLSIERDQTLFTLNQRFAGKLVEL